MTKSIAFVELPLFSGVIPLASGCMEAMCRRDPALRDACRFDKISLPVKTPYADLCSILTAREADVYAFSCYVWNSGLVRRLLDALLAARPQSYFILGGPQVMHQAARYLPHGDERVFVCNGEGERTFAGFLRTLLSPDPDFAAVGGLSFYRGSELVTTEPEPRIRDLSEIPSPFLEGIFDAHAYTWVMIETNRGCPFKCNYCFWGAAIGAKVYKYDEERIERELTWISQSGCLYLYIADANWGMLTRDVDLSRFIVDCRRRYGAPMSVFFSGSKNTPDRVAEITRIFHEAGMIATQSVALQTMSPETLKRVNRDNIKTSTYTRVQQALNQQGIASFTELIWPLPGETLASFQAGLAQLCDIGADSFLVYPLLLMNNVELNLKAAEYGLVTVEDPDPDSEAEIVVQTGTVSVSEHHEGWLSFYAVTSLYSLRGLWYTGRYLNTRGLADYATLCRTFLRFCERHPNHPWVAFCANSIRRLEYVQFSNTGAIVHQILHSEREAFDVLIEDFVVAQDFWGDEMTRVCFEVDLLNRPYIYSNTPVVAKRHRFEQLANVTVLDRSYFVDLPPKYIDAVCELMKAETGHRPSNRFEVSHQRAQIPLMRGKSLREHFMYCQDMSQRVRTLVPVWQPADLADATRGDALSSGAAGGRLATG
ncbi:MAG: B12-binding domain-containing radical SAM protein [Vicinamibacterales bacterium]